MNSHIGSLKATAEKLEKRNLEIEKSLEDTLFTFKETINQKGHIK